jgi:hypothetical protein
MAWYTPIWTRIDDPSNDGITLEQFRAETARGMAALDAEEIKAETKRRCLQMRDPVQQIVCVCSNTLFTPPKK